MAKIRLIKLKEADSPRHPNNIPEGYVVTGDYVNAPEVGEPFWVGAYWRTSMVEEILSSDTFRTMNSIYKIETIED